MKKHLMPNPGTHGFCAVIHLPFSIAGSGDFHKPQRRPSRNQISEYFPQKHVLSEVEGT